MQQRMVKPPILHLMEAESTNNIALDLAADGADAYTVVLAETQTAGRGRGGHAWMSPPGVAIYLSVIVRPRLPLEKLPMTTMAAGVAAASALRAATGLPVGLKWPNDLLVNGRKLAGILCEMSPARAPDLPAVVVGIGINVNNAAEQLPENPIFPATSLAVEAGHPFDRQALVDAFLDALQDAVTRLEAPDGIAETVRQFNEWDALLGKRVAIALPDGSTVTGEEAGAAEDGTLRIQTASGIESVIAGSLSLA